MNIEVFLIVQALIVQCDDFYGGKNNVFVMLNVDEMDASHSIENVHNY